MMKVLNSYWMLVNGQFDLLEQKFLNSEQSMQVQQNLGSCGCECASNLRAHLNSMLKIRESISKQTRK